MKPVFILLALMLVLVVSRRSYAFNVEPADTSAAKGWVANAVEKGPVGPFSFVYDGKPASELLPTWTVKRESTSSGFSVTWTCPTTGLEIRLEGTVYADFPVVEWVLYLKNTGTADSPIIEGIQALDAVFPTPDGDPTLHYAKGATCSMEDYRPMKRILNKTGRTHLQPNGGRSSSDFMPFFNLEREPNKGVVIGIGWSGEWAADFERDEKGEGVRIRCGMANTHLRLHPGEEIRSPRMALLFYDGGSWLRGQNLLRAFLLAHHRPKADGKPFDMPLLNGNWGGTSAEVHLANIKAIIEHDVPADYYWIDAEWFGKGKWHQTVGDWTPKADLYPQGFKPLSDALHADGRKLLLWFEPERVCEGTPWYEEHKDWLLEVPKEKRCYNWGTSQADPDWVSWESARNQIRENDRLFNLANPEARAFLTDFVSAKITEFGLDCFRHDANIAPLEFLRTADTPDRQGITEIRWIEGLYAFWDELLKRHPGLIIDNCASGGRRIDLESISRSTPYWRTDFPAGPVAKQCHTYGISFWTPLNATGATNPGKDDAYAFRSTWSSSIEYEVFGGGDRAQADTDRATYNYDKAKAALIEYRDFRKYFLGDYYPLTEYSQADDAWIAWQFHRADLDEGMVQVFRRAKSICDSGKIVLQGLDPKATYTVKNLDTHEEFTKTGEELASAGFAVALPDRPASAVFVYKRQ